MQRKPLAKFLGTLWRVPGGLVHRRLPTEQALDAAGRRAAIHDPRRGARPRQPS